MIQIDQLPRDANGIVRGAWRVLHESPTYHGGLGPVEMRNGESTSPASGFVLIRIVANYGGKIFLEPWGDLPPGYVPQEGVALSVDKADLARLPVCPWRAPAPAVAPATPAPMAEVIHEASEPADSLDDMTREDLLAFAELHDIDVDRRWGGARLRSVLRSAGATD